MAVKQPRHTCLGLTPVQMKGPGSSLALPLRSRVTCWLPRYLPYT